MKALAFILTLLMVLPLGLCGCNTTGGGEATAPAGTESGTQESATVEAPDTSAELAAQATPGATAAPVTRAVSEAAVTEAASETAVTDETARPASPEEIDVVEIPYGELWVNDSDIAAIAYLCGGGSGAKPDAEAKISELSSLYGFSADGLESVDLNGYSWYLVLPRGDDTKITVFTLDTNGIITGTVKETKSPFYICCEKSDIVADTRISIERNGVEATYSFLPNLSGMGLYHTHMRFLNQFWGRAISADNTVSNSRLYERYGIAEPDVIVCDLGGDIRVLIIPSVFAPEIRIYGKDTESPLVKSSDKPILLLAGEESLRVEAMLRNTVRYTADITVAPDGIITGNSFLRASVLTESE